MKRILILLLLLPNLARAAEPITIEASGSLVWRQSDKTYHALGDAVVTRGTLTVRANELTAHYAEVDGKNEIQRLDATGNVRVDNAGNHAEGPAAQYDITSGEIVMTGTGLRLSNPKGDSLTAEQQIQFNDKTGKAMAIGAPVMTRADRKLTAARMDAQFMRDAKNEWTLQTINATQNVIVTTGNGTPNASISSAQSGFYDAVKDSAILAGDVKISRGQNQLNGDRAEIDMKTGIARLLPSPQSGRVRALLYQK